MPNPTYEGNHPASPRASRAAQGSSKKTDTRCEVRLRKALWRAGCRFRKNAKTLPGCPDIVFPKARVVVFCDGDFWHGKEWPARKAKLEQGTNATYWVAKIERNMERDREHTSALKAAGWTVLRIWESEIHNDLAQTVRKILGLLDQRGHRTKLETP